MDLGRLRALRELSLRGTMIAVAETLYVSPSAVSQQISLLEKEAGIPLIERRGRRVVLTAAGASLAARADRIFAEIEAAQADIAAMKEVINGELRVAAFPSVAAALLPRTIRAMQALHPQLLIRFEELEPGESLASLRSWQTDVALIDDLNVPQGALEANIATIPLMTDVFNVMVAPGHALDGRNAVTLTELKDELWIVDTASVHYTAMLTEACQAAGFTPNITARCNGFEVVIAMIRENCGISILPGLRASHDLEDVWVARLKPEIRRQISLAFRRSEERKPALQAFLAQLRAQAKI
ncbi:LysR family transcriptional regulator [Paracoccus sulfuroxidans]|uniref:DNA-binding transcriptional LysR family regulator n=1 Tax=Paracoccus sulfuroxidans TaxID=384678 RepID=A0A562NT52_9RHOB|nr:LysR family transcriptional regulator [Paracoccus sulfuroxidans]TWI35230.1 DNA-binding transcriptional LysR family regulator [Paracoccus sulfuroxidans]